MGEDVRRVDLYSIYLETKEGRYAPAIVFEVLAWLSTKHAAQTQYDQTQQKKVHFLESFIDDSPIFCLIIKSAKYLYRPPLLDKDTAQERDNPKTKNEGDKEKTHLCFSLKDDEIILAIESKKRGIGVGMFCRYLNHFSRIFFKEIKKEKKRPFLVRWMPIVGEKFLEELEKFDRVVEGEIYLEKQILGSAFLDLNKRTEAVRREISIVLRPEEGLSLKNTMKSAYNEYVARKKSVNQESEEEPKAKILKVRAVGTGAEGVRKLLDSDLIRKNSSIVVETNDETGEVDSNKIFEQMTNMV